MPKYDYPRELLPYQVNQLRPEVLGFHAINPGVASNSPSRSTMMSSHASQHLVTKGMDIPYTLSGTEVEYSKYTTSDRVKWDARVVQVIDRYPAGVGQDSLAFNPEKLVIVVNDQTGEYDVISVPYYKSYHQYFGYQNVLSDQLKAMPPGTYLAKDTVLGDTPGNIGDFYTQTVNLNCMLASPDVVAEDSVMICEDVLHKFENRVYERRSASVGMRKFPVNAFGTKDQYKSFYEIGEYLKEDGAVMWLREYSDGLSPVTMSASSTMRPNFAFDEAIYARQGMRGRIVDIKVIGNSDTISALPPAMAEQFHKYRRAYTRFNEELLSCERRIYQESKQKFGTDEPKFSGPLSEMLNHARAVCDRSKDRTEGKALQALLNKNPMDEFYIEFVIEYTLIPTVGGKVTSLSGDKGVITQILPRHRMPVDAEGTSADIVMGTDGTVARTNFARLYLMQLGATAVKMTKELKRITGLTDKASLEEVEYLSDSKFQEAWKLLMTGYDCVNPPVAKMFEELPEAKKRLHIFECLESEVRLVRDVASPKPLPHAVMDLENFLPTCYGPVTHQLIEDGRTETTIDSIQIAPLPIMLLDKTGEDTLTVATAAHGPFGVLIKHNQGDKYTKPWKDSPARTIGESEGRMYAAHTKDPEMIADMMDRANNPTVQLEMARRLVNSETPGNIPDIIDRSKFDYGDTKPHGIAANLFNCYGVNIKYVPEDMRAE